MHRQEIGLSYCDNWAIKMWGVCFTPSEAQARFRAGRSPEIEGEFMLNWIWLGLILIGIVWAAFTGNMAAVTEQSMEAAKAGVHLIIGFVGPMVFFLGLMKAVQDAGFLLSVARFLRPVLKRLFPDVPEDHPAMGAMVMNMASNMLGLGNAATPFGLKAMEELDKLNTRPGVASNAMVLFLAINTSSITLFPLGVIAIRSSLGAASPEAILVPTLVATICSTTIAISTCFFLQRFSFFRIPANAPEREVQVHSAKSVDAMPAAPAAPASSARETWTARIIVLGACLCLTVAFIKELVQNPSALAGVLPFLGVFGSWLLPLLIAFFLLVGVSGRVRVYESMVEGGKEGLEVAVRIVPYIVAILVAIAIFRASGALLALENLVRPLTHAIGMPSEALPMALMRPLSGSGATGVMMETMTQAATGPDTFVGMLVSTLQGSTETTFYVLALYFGAARISNGRHALATCLTADAAGILGAVAACRFFFPELL
jgi:spore maturation protein SpmA